MNVRQLAHIVDDTSEDEARYEVLIDGEPIALLEFDPETKTLKLWR